MDNNITTHTEYNRAAEQLTQAAAAYYNEQPLLMDDTSYDLLAKAVEAAHDANPAWELPAVLTDVAPGIVSASDTIVHQYPMLSLENAMPGTDEFDAWWARTATGLKVKNSSFAVSVEPKLDGLAYSATYSRNSSNGSSELVQVATRGDGQTGENITAAAARAVGLPAVVTSGPLAGQDFEVRGEAVLTRTQFADANKQRTASGKSAFVNARNGVAGAVRAESSSVAFTAVAYELKGAEALTQSASIQDLKKSGFCVNTDVAGGTAATLAEANAAVSKIEQARDTLDVDIDGAVVKVDAIVGGQDILGARSKAPRWAIARKFEAETRTTKLLDIELSIGRTGALTLRAVLQPVSVGGVKITYATLNNVDHVRRVNLRIGDTVFVRRAADVVPEISSSLLSERPKSSVAWTPPESCPRCSSEWDKTSVIWRCVKGRACGNAENLIYSVSRDALDIEGLGGVHATQLATHVDNVADLLIDVDFATLTKVTDIGDANGRKVMAQIERARTHPMERVLIALGIRKTGRTMSKRLAKHFGTMAALRAATPLQLAEVDGISADGKAEVIAKELSAMADVLDRLADAGIGQTSESANTVAATGDTADLPLAGRVAVVTGSFDGHTRSSAKDLVESLGATVKSSVTGKVDLLISGGGTENNSKYQKAVELGIEIMDGDQLGALG